MDAPPEALALRTPMERRLEATVSRAPKGGLAWTQSGERNGEECAVAITESNLVRHELIGLRVVVRRSPDPSVEGMEGRVVDETRNTLVIDTGERGRRRVAKEGSAFLFTLPDGGMVEVEGRRIRFRPEDRVKRCR
ncbi:MAG: ribonuclease P protein subunit [Thermoplasmata archaeon]